MDITITSSIRIKIITLIVLCIFGLSVSIYFYSSTIFKKSFSLVEKNENINNVELVKNSINGRISTLETKIADWAYWDDTYSFIKDKNKAYIESNLGVGSVATLKINSIVYINTENNIIYKKSVNFYSKEEVSSSSIEEHLRMHPDLMFNVGKKNTEQGIISLPEGPMLIVAAPILNSELNGNVRGKLLFGKYLDSNLINEVSRATNLPVSVYKYDDLFLPTDVSAAKDSIVKGDDIYVSPLSDSTMGGFTVLNDIHGKPALILKVETPRRVYIQGLNNLNSFLTASILSVIFFGIIIYIFIEIFFVYRFSRLSNEVKKIGENKDFNSRVTEGRKDGIGSLAVSINGMLSTLSSVLKDEEEDRDKLKESEKTLSIKIEDLEKANRLMVGRELQMIELKKEIEKLKNN